MARPEILARRREYPATHLDAVIGNAKQPLRPKREIIEDAYRHAKTNGLLQEPYFGTPKTEAERHYRFTHFCLNHWGGEDGLRSFWLPDMFGTCVCATPAGTGRGNAKRMLSTSQHFRLSLNGVRKVANLDTRNANTLLGAGLKPVSVQLFLPLP